MNRILSLILFVAFLRITPRIMDKLRPGWRERAAKRKSLWNVMGHLIAFGLMPVLWYFLFQGAWQLHVYFYPAHAGHIGEFWGSNITPHAFFASALMLLPLFFPSIIAGLILSNLIAWVIRPARHIMEQEAAGDPEVTFLGVNLGLLKIGAVGSAICFSLSFVGNMMLRSLQ